MLFASWRRLRGFGLTAVPVALIAISVESHAQSCVISDAIGVGDPTVDYGPRGGNRCEGLYSRKVSTALNLQIIGFRSGSSPEGPLRPRSFIRVRIQAAPPGTTLRAVSTRARVNYGMDTRALAKDGTFRWDTGIVAAPQIAFQANELALVGCSNACRPAQGTQYRPVRFEEPPPGSLARYTLFVRSVRDLDSLNFELLRDGRSVLKRSLTGSLVSERALQLSLGSLEAGTYAIHILGIAPDGARGPLTATLVIPPERP